MPRKTRAERSYKNPYWISKHRRYELEHFCYQYHEWKRELAELLYLHGGSLEASYDPNIKNPTEKITEKIIFLKSRIELVQTVAASTDDSIASYILKAVTNEELSYYDLNVPCSKNYWYKRLDKFYWLMSRER